MDDEQALAEAIANEAIPDFVEKADGVVTPPKLPKAASKETVEKPASEEKPEKVAEEESDQEVVEEVTDGEPKEGDEDPLGGLDVNALLKHPTLGPAIQRWSDLSVKPQVEQRLEAERGSIVASERRTAEEKQEDEHFASMSKEELTEELTENPKQAAAYARYQARLQAPTTPLSARAVARSSEVYATAHQMKVNSALVEGSELSQEVKESLKAEHFAGQGREGLDIWGQEIFKALVAHEAEKQAQTLHESTWEAEKQERLVELDGDRPPTAPGRKAGSVPDLLGTSSADLFEHAFTNRKLDKPEGAK